MQRQVFPKGRPADTAGFSDDPAATQSSVITLDQRLDALERQMADLLRQSEENGHRLAALEAGHRPAEDREDQRIAALEQRIGDAAAAAPPPAADEPSPRQPQPPRARPTAAPAPGDDRCSAAAVGDCWRRPPRRRDPGEDAYTRASTSGRPASTTRRSRP